MPELNELTPAELDYAVAEVMESKPEREPSCGDESPGGWWKARLSDDPEDMWVWIPARSATSDPRVAAELRQMMRDAGLLVELMDTDLTTRCNILDLDAVRSIGAVSPQGYECRATAMATLEAMRKWPDIAWKQAKGEG